MQITANDTLVTSFFSVIFPVQSVVHIMSNRPWIPPGKKQMNTKISRLKENFVDIFLFKKFALQLQSSSEARRIWIGRGWCICIEAEPRKFPTGCKAGTWLGEPYNFAHNRIKRTNDFMVANVDKNRVWSEY